MNTVTGLAIVGVIVGVAVLNCVIAVMAGFEIDMRDKILGANAHIVVMRHGGFLVDADRLSEKIDGVDGVVRSAPFVYGQMMIRSDHTHTGVVLKGIDPERTGDVTHLRDDLVATASGPLHTIEAKDTVFRSMAHPIHGPNTEDPDLPGIILGVNLLEQLQVAPGDTVRVINPTGKDVGMMGMPMPTVRRFRVVASFDAGMYDYNKKWTYMSNAAAQDFLGLGSAVNGIEVRVRNIDNVDQISSSIQEIIQYPHYTRHWKELNGPLFDALRVEKYVMMLILSMLVLVAGLLILSTMVMVVLTKSREIAILKAMGASNTMIRRVFMMEGSFIGGVGVSVGTVLGVATALALKAYGWPIHTDAYFLSKLPVVIEWPNVAAICVWAFFVAVISSFIPAAMAARLDPVDALRYE